MDGNGNGNGALVDGSYIWSLENGRKGRVWATGWMKWIKREPTGFNL
jgi:hypothetical protein